MYKEYAEQILRTEAQAIENLKIGADFSETVKQILGCKGRIVVTGMGKAGLIGMTKSIVREVAKKNITANCIAPGFIMTEMTEVLPDLVKEGAKQAIPARKFGTVDDVAKAIAFLASDDTGYITGQVISVNGGLA